MENERHSLIAPLSSSGRADEIAVRITEAIQLGLLHDGERLPSESEFAAQFGVSPVTLREAIADLRDRGLLETRRGRWGGTFVKRSLEPDEGPDMDRLRSSGAAALRDIADEQAAISGLAARLAAERGSSSNVERILMLAEQLATAASRGARMKADSRFHIEVAIATRSERLTRREVALQAETTGMLWGSHLAEVEVEAIAAEHREIAAAIADEDGTKAGFLAERHVRNNLRRLTSGHLALAAAGKRPPQRSRRAK
ncbi:GntR family transcriptional regulator [Prauserella sp. PE36]|uniref:FadR family transcriptional regulator n=1 Tax=Prauserella endophytica TaxID=1592324 RepID=A0ABY2SAH0_9PSEU|nr:MULTISPECIES: GntR family transcriptional regulator [Prauserella]PXY23809.1 GntR family transcriptional regulator [Prauserella coralliicola]RBM17268.1 GntR family transcriptional regulator [Prauserella sp. PE36]TKG72466.1 FadR family transcriptional regulator [Prauserella endophytica]